MNNKIKTSANYLAKKMTSVSKNHPNPIETLSVEDIVYLQKYLEHLKQNKIKQISKKGSLNNIPINRATEIYDPMDRGNPIDWRNNPNNTRNDIDPGFLRDISNGRNSRDIDPGFLVDISNGRGNHDIDPGFLVDISNGRGNHDIDPGFFKDVPYFQNDIEPGSRGSHFTRNGKKSQYNNPYECGSRQNMLDNTILKPYTGPYNIDDNLLQQMGINNNFHGKNPMNSNIRNVNIESSLLQKEMTHLPGQRTISSQETDRFQLLPFDPQDHRHIVWTDDMPRGGYATRADRLEI
ncbi:hypothetical protein QLL95_gp1047 [Cotonvirus japonicus]|uniref:Uncharacterized protein n=1 Tax=Cotonvirus japonicus TaxID=2811091 RepID=A0ABM7NSI6_9VIRU|nr:hypothetical protein QLL95_gp1047 [Cotonvirus japonicus]BCS83076.1 hypothetical protein [Cotonvirus japonicus]